MGKILAFAALAALAVAATVPALAAEKAGCGNAPHEQWLSKEVIKAKATALGYDVRRVKPENGCYELYAVDKNGTRVELYLNPVSGELVNTKGDD